MTNRVQWHSNLGLNSCENKKLNHRNLLALCDLGKVIWNCNDKSFFLLYLDLCLLCEVVIFGSGYIITHLLMIFALTDIRSLHCTSSLDKMVNFVWVNTYRIFQTIRCSTKN